MESYTAEFPSISNVVQLYIEGMCEADEAKMRAAFHPKSCCIGHFDGGLEWDGLDAFISSVVDSVKTPDFHPHWSINAVSVTGDVAVVQVDEIWLGLHFDDTLTLLKTQGQWRIVSKVFYLRAS